MFPCRWFTFSPCANATPRSRSWLRSFFEREWSQPFFGCVCLCFSFLPFFGPPLCPVLALAFLRHTCNFCEEYNNTRKPGPTRSISKQAGCCWEGERLYVCVCVSEWALLSTSPHPAAVFLTHTHTHVHTSHLLYSVNAHLLVFSWKLWERRPVTVGVSDGEIVKSVSECYLRVSY